MNFAHLHLILNHLPMFTVPVVLVFFIFALRTQNRMLKRFSLMFLVATSALVLPVYFTGEPAEKVVEQFVRLSEPLIKAHEDSAVISLLLTLVTGGLALVCLFTESKKRFQWYISIALIVTAIFATGSLAYTANLGGKIRHSELLGE